MNNKFHLLGPEAAIMALPERFTCPYCYEPHPLALMAVGLVQHYVSQREDWAEELGAGKMLGVLVAQDAQGRLGFLAAFSGNLAGSVHHDYFVPPVYDLLDPQGEFKRGEAEITAINHEVEQMRHSSELAALLEREVQEKQRMVDEVNAFKAMMAQHKQSRDQRRQDPDISPEELEQLLKDPKRQRRMLDDLDTLRDRLGNSGASKKAAEEVLNMIK